MASKRKLPNGQELPDYYAVFGVNSTATPNVIQRKYHDLIKECHPDLHPGEESAQRAKELGEAYDTLSDPEKRALYDVAYDSSVPMQEQDVPREQEAEGSGGFDNGIWRTAGDLGKIRKFKAEAFRDTHGRWPDGYTPEEEPETGSRRGEEARRAGDRGEDETRHRGDSYFDQISKQQEVWNQYVEERGMRTGKINFQALFQDHDLGLLYALAVMYKEPRFMGFTVQHQPGLAYRVTRESSYQPPRIAVSFVDFQTSAGWSPKIECITPSGEKLSGEYIPEEDIDQVVLTNGIKPPQYGKYLQAMKEVAQWMVWQQELSGESIATINQTLDYREWLAAHEKISYRPIHEGSGQLLTPQRLRELVNTKGREAVTTHPFREGPSSYYR